MFRYLICVGVLLCVFAGHVPASHAQGPAQPSSEQLAFNQQGVNAIIQGNFEEAVSFFAKSLALGELNVTYVNQGRAYQRAGKCDEANDSYTRALKAPAVAEPKPEQVTQVITQYREEMRKVCPGTLQVSCEPGEAQVYLNGAGPRVCTGDALRLAAGTYWVGVQQQGQVSEVELEVRALETTRVQFVLPLPNGASARDLGGALAAEGRTMANVSLREDLARQQEQAVARDAQLRPPSPARQRAPYWLLGAGLGLSAAVAMDTLPGYARNGVREGLDYIPLPIYALGTTALVYGLATWFE